MVMALYAIAEADRSACRGPRPQRDQGPAGAGARRGGSAPGRRHLAATWPPVAAVGADACASGRANACRWTAWSSTAGSASINQAPVTGESMPVDKAVGDPVFAGTINETGSSRVPGHGAGLELDPGAHHPRGGGGPGHARADPALRGPLRGGLHPGGVRRWRWRWPCWRRWLLGWTWMQAIYKALVLLVIACPCALVISTPVTIVSGLAAAARRGILIKGGVYLEEARKLKAIALDKTGTITEGKPQAGGLVSCWPRRHRRGHGRTAGRSAGGALRPPGVARDRGRPRGRTAVEVEDFEALAGRGVQARDRRRALRAGQPPLIEERGQCSPRTRSRAAARTKRPAARVSLLASRHRRAGAVRGGRHRSSHRRARPWRELQALGVTPVMLTGDNQATAAAIAHQAGIDEARGNLLPEDKLAAIKALQAQLRPDGDGRRRHQRRTGAGPGRHRLRHGRAPAPTPRWKRPTW